jgi:methylglyoxal synthase
MNIALIAHDNKKQDMVSFVIKNEDILKKHTLFATGSTGTMIMENTDLFVTRFLSGPLGGDQQIGNLVALEEMDFVFFFRDPLTAQPHEPDVSALMRLCDVHQVPILSNVTAATMFIPLLEI